MISDASLFQLRGHFDMPAALLLREKTVDAGDPAVTIDFSLVAQVDDATLALLTVTLVLLVRNGSAVTVRGLRDHQCRLLEHFGVRVGADGRVTVVNSGN